jgi:hypothetical protein
VWHRHLPAKFREQPNRGLLEKRIFDVGVA